MFCSSKISQKKNLVLQKKQKVEVRTCLYQGFGSWSFSYANYLKIDPRLRNDKILFYL